MSAKWMTFVDLKRLLAQGQFIHAENIQQDAKIKKFGSDSRQVDGDEVFIAIKGERFDGNAYLREVAQKGAIAAIASDSRAIPENFPVCLVKDTVQAIQDLARGWRNELNVTLAVVTGSNGKTTVKEMLASIFVSEAGEDCALATRGNLNNEIGLPMTLLGLHREHRLAVIELGMNHPGETSLLANIACPDVALINNAQREHQEFMKDVEAVALEHASVIDSLGPKGIVVFPADSEYASMWRERAGGRQVVDFEFSAKGEFHSDALVKGKWNSPGLLAVTIHADSLMSFEVQLAILGQHNASNALAATAVAWACGISLNSIQKGLAQFSPVAGRMQVKHMAKTLGGGILIDDSYNANPDSVRAAVDVLAELQGQRWLALGDMGEVGEHGPAFHREVGEYAKQRGIDCLFATGVLSRESVTGFNEFKTQSAMNHVKQQHAQHFDDVKSMSEELIARIKKINKESSGKSMAILVKGSRFMKMERVVNNLLRGESACC